MCVLGSELKDTCDLHIQPAKRLAAGHPSNGQTVIFEDRALFNMGFEVGVEWPPKVPWRLSVCSSGSWNALSLNAGMNNASAD
jgi:hypothetical protein